MASLKEIRSRITSVQSTQQITKAMKMVAAAKLRRAQDAIVQMRPYAKKLNEVIGNLANNLPEDVASQFLQDRGDDRVLLIVLTSDRGLCGAFNSNVQKAVLNLAASTYQRQAKAGNLHLLTIGRKGTEFFGRRSYGQVAEFSNLFEGLRFDNAKRAANWAMAAFAEGQYDRVVIVYNEFKNVATQLLRVEQLLPLQRMNDSSRLTPHPSRPAAQEQVDFIFEPDAASIMEELIPKAVRVQLYKAMLESNASEQGARMTAMDKATENAGELLKDLKLTYNRTRQAAITKEILEIVGGAEALAAS